MTRSLLAAFLLGWAGTSSAQSIPTSEAAAAFATAREVSDRDAGRTWGMPVCGPILFADPATREVVANRADAEGRLTPRPAVGASASPVVWGGTLPPELPIANTAVDWAGVRFTMVMWPLPGETRRRAQLLAHECYHRIQPALGLPANDAMNGHLDGRDGRTWLLLEWRALERALMETGPARRQALTDALRFRAHRRSLLTAASAPENRLEMNEGLAEYTGVRLANTEAADRRATAIYLLRDGPGRASLVRSFAYVSGPAYGLLLDETGVAWRKGLKPDSDLGALAARVYGLPASPPGAGVAAARYGGEALVAAEALRARKHEERLAAARRLHVEGPVVVLPVGGTFSFGFNPNDLLPLDGTSTVYPSLHASDDWGVLDGSGMLVREAGAVTRVVVPGPATLDGATLTGSGWKLELKPGYRLSAGSRSGDQIVTRE